MGRYLIKRLVSGLLTLFLFITLLFFISQILIPGDFVTQFGMSFQMSGEGQEGMDRMREQLGLDLPLYQQYFRYLGQLASGDLGNSFYGIPVWDIFRMAIPSTLLVFILGILTSFLIGQWLGKAIGWSMPPALSRLFIFSGVTLYTAFPPWLAFLVVYLIGGRMAVVGVTPYRTRFFEPYGLLFEEAEVTPEKTMLIMFLTILASVATVSLAAWFVRRQFHRRIPAALNTLVALAVPALLWQGLGIWEPAFAIAKVAALPFLTFILLTFAESMLIMRTNISDTRHEDYVMAARAKGLPERVVRDDHAARNAILPVLSNLVLSLPYMITGIVIIETATGWTGGIGSKLFYSMANQDMPVVLGTLLMIGIFSITLRLVLDIVHALMDPRIRMAIETTGEAE
jgi:peptide/nickel transport system permease protein